jgi:hypothetical protein
MPRFSALTTPGSKSLRVNADLSFLESATLCRYLSQSTRMSGILGAGVVAIAAKSPGR